jgi:hypothetical protein
MKTTPTAPSPAEGLQSNWRSFLAGWDRFWFRPANPTTLCLIRLCAGMAVLYVHLSYSFDLMSYVGRHAWVDQQVADFMRQRSTVDLPADDWKDAVGQSPQEVFNAQHHPHSSFLWSIFYHISDPRWIWVFHALAGVVIAMFMLGLCTRTTSVLTWMASMCYTQRAITNLFGMDTMLNILLLYLMIGDSGACLSLDRLIEKWRARRRGEPIPPVRQSVSTNVAIRLMQVHFCFIYIASGTAKLMGTTWWGGTALWRTFLNYTFAPMDSPVYMKVLTFMAEHRVLWEAFMSFGVLFTFWTELGLPFLVWDLRWRWFMITCAVMLHTGIGLFMGLVMFSMMMIILVFSFAPPEHVEAFLKGLARRARRLLQWAGRPAVEGKKPELVGARS